VATKKRKDEEIKRWERGEVVSREWTVDGKQMV
jgi:hypothetical protein